MFTRRKWCRRLAVVLLLLVLAAGYHSAILVFTAAKVLNHGAVFDWWNGAAVRLSQEIGGIPADLYTSSDSGTPLLFIHGVNESGKDSAEIKPIAQAFAGSGFRVIVPDLARLRRQTVSPADIDDIVGIVRSFSEPVGIVCASYGCGPALIAAARREIRDRVRFVVTFGGYFDLRETLRSIVTSPPNPWAYSKWLYMSANADVISDAHDRGLLRQISAERQKQTGEKVLADGNGLGPQARALLALFESTSAAEFDAKLEDAPEFRDRLDYLSPSHYVADLGARLIIVHLRSDPSIPSRQSFRLAEAAAIHKIPYSLTILNLYGHTHPEWPRTNVQNTFRIYLPESWKFLRVLHEVLSYS